MTETPRSTARALAAQGVPVTLVDGSVVHLRYTFRSLMVLEEEHGNLGTVMQKFMTAAEQLDASIKGEPLPEGQSPIGVFTTLVQLMAPGLLHETDPVTGDSLGDPDGVLPELLEFGHLLEYIGAFSQAFGESFKQTTGQAGGGGRPPRAATTKSSRGQRGGASQSAKQATTRSDSGA